MGAFEARGEQKGACFAGSKVAEDSSDSLLRLFHSVKNDRVTSG